jgi:mannose-1-phosphate guanylyltransferase
MIRKAVILVGGPSRGTRFRPLSLEIPKPLFPIGGVEMIWHTIAACAKVPDMKEILLVGFYEPARFTPFMERAQREFDIPIHYLREYQPLGTGGGIYHFREQILRGKPTEFFVLHSDICCAFPLTALLECHKQHAHSLCTVLGKRVPEFTSNYGCIVKDQRGEIMHYVEKPETFVSDLINCGVYVFSPRIFDEIGSIISTQSKE